MPSGKGYELRMSMEEAKDLVAKGKMPPQLLEHLKKKGKAKEDSEEDSEKAMPDKDMDKAKMMGDDEDPKDSAEKAKKDDEDDAEKSLRVTEEELAKSLDSIQSYIAKSAGSRRQDLLSKAAAGTATDDETAELAGLLTGSSGTLGDEVVKGLDPAEDEELAKSLDVSDYLERLHDGLVTYCRDLGNEFAKSRDSTDQGLLVLAKGLLHVGKAMQELSKSQTSQIAELRGAVDHMSRVPARAPKALSGAQAIEKSHAGHAPAGDTLSKSQVLDLLEEMHKSSLDAGRNGKALCGEDLNLATSKWEQLQQISPALQRELTQFYAAQRHGARR